MIFKGSSDLSPKVTIAIDAVPVDYTSIKRLTVELREDMHSLVILEFAGLNPRLINEYLEQPMKVTIEMRDRDTMTFCGYITQIEPMSASYEGAVNNSPFQLTRVYCLGASYLMKSKYSRVWENVTLAEIGTELSDKYQFSISVPNDSYRFPRLVQSAESDWSFLVNTAKALGYSTIADNSHIHIWDRYKAVSRRRSYNALYTLRGMYGNPSPQPGQIMKFDGTIGAVTTNGSKTYDTAYVLDKTGNVISVSNASVEKQSGLGVPVGTRFTNTYSVNADSYEMGQRLVEGELRNKFPFSASVDVVGDPSIQPGGIVNINEYNSQFDGFWYVTGVRHEISQSTMASFVNIVKDSFGGTTSDPVVTSMYASPPDAVLRNSKWISETEMVNVYA